MSGFVWWLGMIHLAVYAAAGSIAVLGWCIWKVHAHVGLMSVILRWHWARRHVCPSDKGRGHVD